MDNLVDFLLGFYGPKPYFLVFGILVGCGLGIPIPEDIILLSAGLLSYYGLTDCWTMVLVAFVGVLAGDSIIYFLGATYGRKLTKKWFFHKLLPDDRLNAVQNKFQKHGNKLIFAARFMPGFRAPMYFSAGTLHLPFRTFISHDGAAALISVPTIIFCVYYFGDYFERVFKLVKKVEHGIVIFIVFAILVVAAKWYITHRRIKKNAEV